MSVPSLNIGRGTERQIQTDKPYVDILMIGQRSFLVSNAFEAYSQGYVPSNFYDQDEIDKNTIPESMVPQGEIAIPIDEIKLIDINAESPIPRNYESYTGIAAPTSGFLYIQRELFKKIMFRMNMGGN